MQLTKEERRQRRHRRIRKVVTGTPERPRLYVRKTLKHLHVQVIDDTPEGGSRTIGAVSTATKETAGQHRCNIAGAQALGKQVASTLATRGVKLAVFDRGGYRYHGVIKALADSIREAGVQM